MTVNKTDSYDNIMFYLSRNKFMINLILKIQHTNKQIKFIITILTDHKTAAHITDKYCVARFQFHVAKVTKH